MQEDYLLQVHKYLPIITWDFVIAERLKGANEESETLPFGHRAHAPGVRLCSVIDQQR